MSEASEYRELVEAVVDIANTLDLGLNALRVTAKLDVPCHINQAQAAAVLRDYQENLMAWHVLEAIKSGGYMDTADLDNIVAEVEEEYDD